MPDKITVYRVKLYNGMTDETILSRRMATAKGAEMMGGAIIENTAVEIDASLLEPGAEWTAPGFNPKADAVE